MRELLLILIGILCLTIAGLPGLVDEHRAAQGVLIGVGLSLSIVGEIAVWKRTRTLEGQLAKVESRSLSDEQRVAFQKKLAAGERATVGVCSRLMDSESTNFAEQLASVFEAAGWPIATPIKTSLNDLPGYVSLFVTGEGLEATAAFICDALNEVGVECRPQNIEENSVGGSREPDAIYIVVGHKGS